jgi:hypothetical protein
LGPLEVLKMHPNLHELLAHRNGEGTVETARHVETCDGCQSAVAELRQVSIALNELPAIPPPTDAWKNIRDRVRRRRRMSISARLAAAAAVVAAVAMAIFMTRLQPAEEARMVSETDDTRAAIEQLSGASRELEMVLRETSLQTRVLSPRRAATIVELEDRIALVDLALSRHAVLEPDQRAVALWSDRVELLDALVTVRGGDRRSSGVTHAVNQQMGRQP